jgi:DNA-directed RNA polymerase specialized sigma24 family protein
MQSGTIHLPRPCRKRVASLDALFPDDARLGDFLSGDNRPDCTSAAGRDRMDRLDELLALLTARQREILLMSVECGNVEAARRLGVVVGSVAMTKALCLLKFQRAIAGQRVCAWRGRPEKVKRRPGERAG